MSDIQIRIQQLEHALADMGVTPGVTLSPLSSDFSFDEDTLSSVPAATLPVYASLLKEQDRRHLLAATARNRDRSFETPEFRIHWPAIHDQATDKALTEIQFRISGIFRILDDALLRASHRPDGFPLSDFARLANNLYLLAADAASFVTAQRIRRIYVAHGLPPPRNIDPAKGMADVIEDILHQKEVARKLARPMATCRHKTCFQNQPHFPNQHNTTLSTRPQPPVVPHRLLRQCRQLTEAGLSSDAISIALHPAAQMARTRAYSSIQDQFSTWCEERSIQATKAAAADIVNFLAEGRVHLHWEPSTILNYRSALLDMQDDPSRLTHSGAFSAFFTAIDRSALLSFDKSAPDISPILTSFRSLGPSATLSIPDLTRKLCWLLAVTGFMRPSDIARIDASRLAIHTDHAYLVIVAPKELRRGRRIERPVHIHRHPDPLICPVDCLTAYKANILDIYLAAPVTHPTAPHLTFTPLIRDQRRPLHGIGTQRISKHIQAIMSIITSSCRILGRSLGSDAASKHGASLDEVLTQGFWSAAGVFDTHYRINRRSQTNLTTLALRAPSPHTSSHCCDD